MITVGEGMLLLTFLLYFVSTFPHMRMNRALAPTAGEEVRENKTLTTKQSTTTKVYRDKYSVQ